jgi:VanZ family protein
MRKVLAAYWLLLTFLLLARHPLGWFSENRTAESLYGRFEPVAHLVSFTLLTLLALSTRWRITRYTLVALLAVYGVATELVQSQIPGRSMQLVDLVQDLAGIVLGIAVYWTWQRCRMSRQQTLPVNEVWQQPRRRSEVPTVRP